MSDSAAIEDRLGSLEDELEQLRTRVRTLEEENQRLREKNRALRERVTGPLKARLEALTKRSDTNAESIAELQSRELEKGAHLAAGNVREDRLAVAEGRVEIFEKDAGPHVRIPGSEDALNRGGETRLAQADLLPIQQLARLDEEMLASESRPVRIAVKAWQEREIDAQKSRNDARLWKHGSKDVREYLDAGDLATWIRIEEMGVSKEYAQKLASRAIDAVLDLTKGRLYDELRTHRKDGLQYKERRLVVPADAAIPGETGPTLATTGVSSE